MMILLTGAALLVAAERPSGNGDPIGVATRDHGGRMTIQLRSVQCDGTIVEGLVKVEAGNADYRQTLRWLGGIGPGETKIIRARDLKPCSRQ